MKVLLCLVSDQHIPNLLSKEKGFYSPLPRERWPQQRRVRGYRVKTIFFGR